MEMDCPLWDHLLVDIAAQPCSVKDRLDRLFSQVDSLMRNCAEFLDVCLEEVSSDIARDGFVGMEEDFLHSEEFNLCIPNDLAARLEAPTGPFRPKASQDLPEKFKHIFDEEYIHLPGNQKFSLKQEATEAEQNGADAMAVDRTEVKEEEDDKGFNDGEEEEEDDDEDDDYEDDEDYEEEKATPRKRQKRDKSASCTKTSGGYKCEKCSYATKYKPNFETHMNKHNGIKPYLCQHCDKSYYTNAGLDIHINKVHLNKREYSCLECDKHFCTKGELSRHLKFGAAHMTEEMAAVCHLCGKSFANKIRLKVHLMGFHGNSMKSCPYCGKYFKTLEVHIAHMHSGSPVEKTYPCMECDLRFKTKTMLCDHRQDAHGIQSWHCCDRCDNKFTSASRLQCHIKVVHLKEKANCPGCGKEFSEMDSVKKHIKAGRCKGDALDEATREQYLSNVCPKCKKQFGRATVLAKHLESKTCEIETGSSSSSILLL